MCGIAGIYAPRGTEITDKECVLSMVTEQRHRGPDHIGIHVAEKFVFGHALLSIIGVGSGRQPIANEDEAIWITFNGEIYNFRELRSNLIKKGHQFKTKTDTEVIVHLYEDYGIDFVHHLDGMFAFALWDARKEQLILVRDRLGVKPLYWFQEAGRVYFASEMKALIRHTTVSFDVNPVAIDHYLAFKCVGPSRSVLKSVHKLAPGCLAVFNASGSRVETYWAPVPRNQPMDPMEEIPRLVSEATKRRLISEVPLSVSLSGGIDSSIVLYEVTQTLGETTTAFSIRYPGAAEDESEIARRYAKQLGINHHIVDFPGLDLDQLPRLAEVTDEPLGDYSAYPSRMLFEAHREKSTVVLTGDGGDEAFGGYKRYLLSDKLALASRSRAFLVPLLQAFGVGRHEMTTAAKLYRTMRKSRTERYEAVLSNMTPAQRAELMSDDLNSELEDLEARFYMSLNVEDGTIENSESLLDYMLYLPGVVLEKVDRCSMANSVEVRSPFLDYRIVEYGLSLPKSKRFGRGGTKIALREAYRGKIPDEILDGKKRGFTVPLDYWGNQPFRDFTYDVLLSSESRNRGIFAMPALQKMLDASFANKGFNSRHIWNVLMLELWFQAFSK